MHVSIGAFEVNAVASVGALLFGGVWLLMWQRARTGYMLLLAAGWCALCIYWGLIAISAGYAPVWTRAELSPYIRATLLLAVLLLAWGKVALMWLAWRCSVRHQGEATKKGRLPPRSPRRGAADSNRPGDDDNRVQ